MVNIFKEHMASEKKKGGWCIQEEWNFWDLSYKTCSLAYKFMNDLRIRLLLINENDNQQALKMARELERYIDTNLRDLYYISVKLISEKTASKCQTKIVVRQLSSLLFPYFFHIFLRWCYKIRQ